MARANPFTGNPYGTHSGPRGSWDTWRAAFGQAMGAGQAAQILGEDSPWSILGLEPGADEAALKKAFRKKAMETHPDRFPPDQREQAEEAFKRLQAAWVSLGGF